jgi:glucose-6-phosphate 1-epimerase
VNEISLSLPVGDHVRIALHGAHVLSWRTADGQERLYLSPQAVLDGKSPIRGGVPVCFPQFNTRVLGDMSGGVPLPKHGFARTLPWQATSQTATATEAVATLTLQDNPQTRAFWPCAFIAQLQVCLTSGQLNLEFSVRNTDTVAWPFALAMHTYLQVNDIAEVALHGLQGQSYWDAVQHLQDMTVRQPQAEAALTFPGETDRVYAAVTSPVTAGLTLRDKTQVLHISQSANFTETVVWNPGPVLCAALSDMPDDGYRHMLCVEAARIDTPVMLHPGESWMGWQRLAVV